MRHLATVSSIPHKATLIASEIKRIVEESVVGLITAHYVAAHLSHRQYRCAIENYHTCQSVRAIHQTGRTFKYFDRVNRRCVYLNSVLIAPLLTFLTHTVVYNHYTIISHSAYNGL